MRRGAYNTCPVCGENYDCGERHECEGPVEPPAAPDPPRRVDKHLEACQRLGMYVQPGYTLGYKRGRV